MKPSTASGQARSPRVSELIDQVASRITNGAWPVGTQLPVEAELMQEFKVGRVTLRQAIQALVHVGMLETIQGSGTFVRSETELDAVLTRYLGAQNLDSILEVRLAIESEAAALAAQRATDDDLSGFEAILADARQALSDGDRPKLDQLSSQFHYAVIGSSGNPVLVELYAILEDAILTTFEQGPHAYDVFIAEHTGIVQAIRDRDPDKARRLAREHLVPLLQH